MDTTLNWPELLRQPRASDHLVQVYRDKDFLVEAVVQFVGSGLAAGEAAIIIARPEHRERFERALEKEGLYPSSKLVLLDAEETLGTFMADGMPDWSAFHRVIGSAIDELYDQHRPVRAYGEMVDLLWQRDERPAAVRLEEFWNDLAGQHTFSLLCAYGLDPLRSESYDELESVCRTHTHLIPARDYAELNEAVLEASRKVLDRSLAQMLLTLAANRRAHTHMPLGQAALIWLKQNMPRTADRVLGEVRARLNA